MHSLAILADDLSVLESQLLHLCCVSRQKLCFQGLGSSGVRGQRCAGEMSPAWVSDPATQKSLGQGAGTLVLPPSSHVSRGT